MALLIIRKNVLFLWGLTVTELLCGTAASSTAFGVSSSIAFAGFGAGNAKVNSSKNKKKKSKSSSNNSKRKSPTPTGTASKNNVNVNSIMTPQDRMAYIESRIRQSDVSSISKLTLLPGKSPADNDSDSVSLDIDPNAICVVDNFLGADWIAALRTEAESLRSTMVPSQSTRWDEDSQSVVTYQKHQVLSMQIEGGPEGYQKSPRLVEYIVTLTQHLTAKLNPQLPEIYQLSSSEQTNKLAVCLGDGSYYDKHIDNGGGTDRRKLTALLYLQPPEWHTDAPPFPNESEANDPRGGYFRAYDVPERGQVTSVAPRGDRLLLFWSDSLVHDVSPSFAPFDDVRDQRWALTVWLTVNPDQGVIRSHDAAIEGRHFGSG